MIAMRCAGCGHESALGAHFRCPNAGDDDVDHVLERSWSTDGVAFPMAGDEQPFVRFRELLLPPGAPDWSDRARALDARVAAVDGRGFRVTPWRSVSELASDLGVAAVWIKDETGNVSGSHKARHLFGLGLYLEPGDAPFAIASCGNAALAAAVVARALSRRLRVYVPPGAPASTMTRLRELSAETVICPRGDDDPPGDPCYLRFREGVARGEVPFCCQGNENGLTIPGGMTLAWELIAQHAAAGAPPLDRVLVQVGGGALMSATVQAFRIARELGALERLPRFHAVQARRHQPLARAWERAGGHGDEYLRTHRSEFMRPAAEIPDSVASGILDDETYDWLQIVRGMRETGGAPVTVHDETIVAARLRAREVTGSDVCPTGAAGLAGGYELAAGGALGTGESIGVVLTGASR